MKRTKKEPGKIVNKKTKKKIEPKPKKKVDEKMEDVQKLVHLLQVHQVELEHQNEELRITQEELESSRNKYVTLFDFSPIPYFTLDTDGTIKEVNLSASKMFGFDRKKIIGRRFSFFVPLDDKDIFNSFIKTIFDSQIKQTCQLQLINKNKQVFIVQLEGLKLDDSLETNQLCQVALIDLTVYKTVEKTLKETNAELKILNASKDKYFSIIAHDLRSPFQSLLSTSEILSTEVENLSKEEIILFSRGLNDNLKNLFSLLENLLNWSLMQRDMLDYNPEKINLNAAVNNIIEILNPSALKKNISISNNIDAGTMVYADVEMLRSVVQNLLINAIKFSKAKGEINISATKKRGFVEVVVQDTGIGISYEISSNLFSFNAIYTTNGTAGEKGTGLGLPLCKEFVERHGGKIWVESNKNVGSTFYFTLPKAGS